MSEQDLLLLFSVSFMISLAHVSPQNAHFLQRDCQMGGAAPHLTAASSRSPMHKSFISYFPIDSFIMMFEINKRYIMKTKQLNVN